MQKVVAIVPAKNEEKTIGAIVAVLRSSPHIAEVIVVSEGSTDGTPDAARAAGARVLESSVSHGKGAAMRRGTEATDAEVVLFVDGDLMRLTKEHIDQLVRPVLDGRLDMRVGFIDRGVFNFIARAALMSGQRAVRRASFLALPEKFSRGYSIEISLNYFFRLRGWKYASVPLVGLGFRKKVQKVGILRGLWQYAMMWGAIWRGAIRIHLAHVRGEL